MSDEADREIQRALREWERQDPPPEPPVEAMWGAIRPELPLRPPDLQPAGGARPGGDAAGGDTAKRDTVRGDTVGGDTGRAPGPRRARSGARVWIPALLAAGLAGLVLGRATAPTDSGTSGSAGAEPPSVALADAARQDEGNAGDAAGTAGSRAEPGEEGAGQEPGRAGIEAAGQDRADDGGPGAGAVEGSSGEDPRDPGPDTGGPGAAASADVSDPGARMAEAGAAADTDREHTAADRDASEPGAPGEGRAPPDPGAWLGASSSAPLHLVATRHLLEVGPMLTRLAGGADPERGTVPPEIRDWARRLLDETRLILDTPAPLDGEIVALLEDLEMILTQVATIPTPSPDVVRLELEIIAEGMSDRRILPRIRTLAGAGTEQ